VQIHSVGREIEKMSKSKYNVVTQMIFVMNTEQTLYVCNEMFLGPLSKRTLEYSRDLSVWFLEKLCRLYFDEHNLIVTDEIPTKDNLKHYIKPLKVADDREFLFNSH
jgi:leucyl-tRNA synthetase